MFFQNVGENLLYNQELVNLGIKTLYGMDIQTIQPTRRTGTKKASINNCNNFTECIITIQRKINTLNLKLDNSLQWSVKEKYKDCHKTYQFMQ